MSIQVGKAKSMNNRRLVRSCESLLGICNGLIADGDLNDREIIFLSTWLSDNDEISQVWPGQIVHRRVRDILADGIVTSEERQYLVSTLEQLVGGSFAESGSVPSGPNELAIAVDADVVLQGKSFCFTGQFVYGTRAACERATLDRDGFVIPSVTKKVDFLVVGDMASRDWKNSSHGTKIEAAIALASAGSPIQVISESQWIRAIGG